MKSVKYVMMGALMLSLSTPLMAQDDNKATIDAITKVITSNPAGAADQVKDVFKKNKKNAEVLVGIARAYFTVKDTANARNYVDLALKADKKYSPAYLLLGDIAVMNNDGGEAASQYQQAIYFDPKNPDAYYKYANIYRKTSPAEAVSKLEELRAQRPDIAVDGMAGHIYYLENDFTKAIERFSQAWNSQKDKMTESNLTEYAMSLFFKQKNQESLDVAKYGLTKNNRDAAFNRLAFFNSTDLKQYDDALAYADALFNKSDSAKFSYFDYTYYGNAYLGKKDYTKAIEMLQKALTMEFDSKSKRAGVVKALSDAYKQSDDYDNAIKYYKEYLSDVEKPSATDRAGFAWLYVLQAQDEKDAAKKETLLKEAIKVYTDLKNDEPDAADFTTYKIAQVNSMLDPETKQGLAKPYYEELANMINARENKDAADKARLLEAYRYLGYYYLLQNKKAESDGYWKKVLELDPENEAAKQVLGLSKKK